METLNYTTFQERKKMKMVKVVKVNTPFLLSVSKIEGSYFEVSLEIPFLP